MSLGVYIHIPYCLQICPYCDFTKYELGTARVDPKSYVSLLHREIQAKAPRWLGGQNEKPLDTIYFGGGTPSLLEPHLILSVIDALANAGFPRKSLAEVTIEIDPATVDGTRLDQYLAMGVNRFSVGAQTFNDRLLKIAGRKHSAQETVELLKLLRDRGVNYSFDLLFALPTQTLEELKADVVTALSFEPSHLSAYCLTVPENHPMAKGRAPDEEQTVMFDLVESRLREAGIERYEISNFAKPGFESQHNLRYWTDQPYWGLGVSSHSYMTPGQHAAAPWGTRFWNAASLQAYERSVQALSDEWDPVRDVPESDLEALKKHQALTDFCHTSLRLTRGLDENALRLRFGDEIANHTRKILEGLEKSGLVCRFQSGWKLSRDGKLLANTVFEKLTFLEGELTSLPANS